MTVPGRVAYNSCMCGIVGIYANNYERDLLHRDLENAVASLDHRGPDDRGTWLGDSGIGLGHTRLSILDLSPLGHQPMISPDGRYVIVFNGEIYNYAEIRKELSARGHTFSGSSDTEVILNAYSEWGSDAVHKFIGMFAIAIWDKVRKRLELIRDRAGVKPLYYSHSSGSLVFASELRALRAFRHWRREIDSQSLGEFFQYGYVPDNRSIYQNVFKLSPGHRLVFQPDKPPTVEQYWSLTDSPGDPLSGTDREIEADLESLLVDAFRYRMVSDVPVGVYLSGGVDSSLVTALLAKHHDQTIRTFTIGFSEKDYDESDWARKVAEYCGTSHTEYILDAHEALQIAHDWGELFDEPFADASSIPTLLVSRLASRDVKVVLSADGGDELFSGYSAYETVLHRAEVLRRLPAAFRYAASAGLSALSILANSESLYSFGLSGRGASRIRRRLATLNTMFQDPTPLGLIDLGMSRWLPEQVERLLGTYDRPIPSGAEYEGDPAVQISLRDFHHYLPGDILTKVDRTTMAVSIEGREPLLDHRIAEFALRLPAHLRRGTLGPKHLLKSILFRHVPREYVDRPKQGFAIPMERWLQHDLRELVGDLLSPTRIRDAGLMNPHLVERTIDEFYKGNGQLGQAVWSLLAFEMWREHWT